MNTDNRAQSQNFFLHLGVIVALYTSAISFIAFMFQAINYAFPDRQAYYGDPFGTGMRMAISTLFIAFPVMIYLIKLTHGFLKKNTSLKDGAVRRWLAYFTIFVAGIVLAGDLIFTLNQFLSGEITTRFILKALTVLFVAGAVFWFTFKDLKGEFFEKPKSMNVFLTIVSVVVLGAIVWGFTMIGSPATQRKLRDDMTRVTDLQAIQGTVINRYQTLGKLPASLDELVDDLNYSYMKENLDDPETGERYEYRTIASSTPTFELCANFALDTKDMRGRGDYPGGRGGMGGMYMDYARPYPIGGDFTWDHVAGRNCFTRSLNPELYPIYPKPRLERGI